MRKKIEDVLHRHRVLAHRIYHTKTEGYYIEVDPEPTEALRADLQKVITEHWFRLVPMPKQLSLPFNVKGSG